MFFHFLLYLLASHSHAEILGIKDCSSFLSNNFNEQQLEIYTVYESKTLCGFVMNKNTVGFNEKGVADNQKLMPEDIELMSYKGRWINIFSKDGISEVTDKALIDLGITEEFRCLSALPIKIYVQCPVSKKDIFETIAKSREESFIKKVYKF
jgi:hypothetical protein